MGSAIITRAWISLTIGQFVDTAVFVSLAFAGKTPLPPVIVGQYSVKLALSGLSVPLVGLAVAFARRLISDERTALTADVATP